MLHQKDTLKSDISYICDQK
jgi:hypothetical protein